ncbi:MAG: FxsA family protein [Gammaproteobacteria bacterium]|nr:FxsA family protein [Gammaproteobacteria bacterium]
MLYVILPLIIALPLLELYLLIKAGGLFGAIPTIALVVFSAVLGTLVLRWQGWIVLQRFRATLARGAIPARELLEGMIVLASGVLLLIPGFISDLCGLFCLIPAVRRLIIRSIVNDRHTGGGPGASHPSRGPHIIEGEFWKERIKD